jgi:hypothetical protein
MSSIIKVDAIQKADGTTPTAQELGVKVDKLETSSGTSALTLRSDGVVVHNKIPHLKVGASGAVGMGGSFDYIRYNSFNTSHVFDPEDNMNAYSTADARYTIPAGCNGLWHISASLYATTSNVNQLGIQVNGTREDAIGSDAGSTNQNQGAIVKRLAAGDQIRILAFYGANITTQSNAYHTWWEMTYLG